MQNDKIHGISVIDFATQCSSGYSIDETKLFALLYPDRPNRHREAVSTSPAQYIHPCKLRISLDQYINALPGKLEKLQKQSHKLYCIACLQFSSSCRISEILQIKYSEISKSGHVKISGLKNSYDKIIFHSETVTYLLRCRSNSVDPFSEFNRFFVYRCYKKAGISFRFPGNCVNSVTHSFRHVNSALLKAESVATETIQKHIGHKSSKSTKYYTHEKKKA